MKNINCAIIYSFIGVMTLFSCEKQEFVSDPGTPVFMVEVPFLNEDDFNVIAGDELYYMFASHQQTENAIVYSGLFGKEDICEEACAENFAIKIVEKEFIQESIATGKYEFYSVPKDGFKHNFSIESTDDDVLNWTTWRVGDQNHFGEGSISFNSDNDSAPQDGVQLLYDVPGQFIVQFDRPVLPKSTEGELTLQVVREQNEGVFIEVNSDSPFTFVSWSTGAVGNRIEVDFATQSYSANVIDGSGSQTKLNVHFKSQNMNKDYSISLKQESYMFSTPDNSDRSVIIEYTDKEGEFYTTSVIGQILPFEFNVLDIEPYDDNELGQPTWKINATFDCILFGENGGTKRIVGGKAVFAVSY